MGELRPPKNQQPRTNNQQLNLVVSAIVIVNIAMIIDDYVCDVLMRDLVGHDRQPTSFLVYLYLAYEIGRSKRERVQVSYKNLAGAIGVSKSAAQQAVAWLVKRRLLESKKDAATAVPIYRVLRPWRN